MSEWILFKDKLPKDNQRILTTVKSVTYDDYVVRSGTFTDCIYPMVANDNGDCWNITDKNLIAWMSLPEPMEVKK